MDPISKKKLDFCRPTFDEREFKIPFREMTNTFESSYESQTTRMQSEKSTFADDEASYKDSDTSSQSSVSTSMMTDKVSVYLRLKPTVGRVPDEYHFCEQTHNVFLRPGQQNQVTAVERQYTFSSILNQLTDQRAVYEGCVRPLINDPFSSNGGVICSYGVSSSGKTYTILGEKSAGIVPRALTQIFTEYENNIAPYPYVKVNNDQIAILDDARVEAEINLTDEVLKEFRKHKKSHLSDNWIEDIKNDHEFQPKDLGPNNQTIFIWVSFVEIYNEKIIDLLDISKPGNTVKRQLKIMSNDGNSFVLGLTWLHVSKLENAFELLQQGLRKVNYASTGLNSNSSRSHTIFTINMISECDSSYEFSSFKFCDLAGAERTSKTGNVGDRLKEAGTINKSLVVLGRCLDAQLHNQKPNAKKEIVPVRESKLTFLLQGSLMGHVKFVMIVNLLPTIEFYEENVNVLYFGSIANKIVTKKIEARKFSRCSSRYSYFMQHAVGSPKMNSSQYNNSIFEERDESSLDLSYQRSIMTADELRAELREKDLVVQILMDTIREKELEILKKENLLRQEITTSIGTARDAEKKHYEQQKEIMESYHNKKMEQLRLKSARKYNELIEDFETLERENQKLKKKFGITDDDGVIDVDDDSSEEDL